MLPAASGYVCIKDNTPLEQNLKRNRNSSHGFMSVVGNFEQLCIYITKTCLYNFDPLKPHFYIVKLGFTGVYIIFLTSAQKHRLWVLVRTASLSVLTSTHNLCFEQKYWKISEIFIWKFSVFGGEIFYIQGSCKKVLSLGSDYFRATFYIFIKTFKVFPLYWNTFL